ncbi:SpoIIE family protein phosphatase [Brumimicrobium salinarum]|uniref:SpoIIE family protein phosphatase n=1 Tax=Brumimicrobium salinarum TaxID=2058658 RepID=UPI0013FD564D|nr:SpoIIE family protein phosphatase [Brumimicrobium salinarum]
MEYTLEKMAHIPFSHWDEKSINNEVFPGLRKNPEINSFGLANSKGQEYVLFQGNEKWYSRTYNPSEKDTTPTWKEYVVKGNTLVEVYSWSTKTKHNPKERPWYKGAQKTDNEKYWTAPYRFNINQKLGMSVSQSWKDQSEKDLGITITYSFYLDEVVKLLNRIKPTEKSKTYLTYNDTILISVTPKNHVEIKKIDDDLPAYIKTILLSPEPKKIKIDEESYWGSSDTFNLSREQRLTMSILIPEKDFLTSINKLQTLLLIGFTSLVIVALLVLALHIRQIEYQKLLIEKGKVIEEKREEILKSIQYAKYIQDSMMPSNEEIQEKLKNSSVIHLPKDIVAGDFYWVQKHHPYVLFAVGDCTGHGVPGAMISVMCQTALNRSVLEFSLFEPHKILDKTKELFLEQININNTHFNDGMDISFCILNRENNYLYWSGANNPLYIIKHQTNELITFKADKQPIGRFPNSKPFSQKEIQLEKGDRIYLFTDGFQDQFGGPKQKKYNPANFRKLLIKTNTLTIPKQKQVLLETFNKWKGEMEQIDDMCILVVEV